MHVVQSNRKRVVFDFLRERICELRKSPNAHPHGEVLPFHKGCADASRVGIPLNPVFFGADAYGG